MSDTYSSDTPTTLVMMNYKKLFLIILCGLIAGIVTWGLTHLLDAYVYKAILCRSNAAVQCGASYQYATTTASVIGAAIGLFGLVRLQVYRPLLIVIATYVALWTLLSLVLPLPWYAAALLTAGMYGIAFGIFAWLARIRKFYIALIVVILLVVAIRLILNS
jgi:hypothetical protein